MAEPAPAATVIRRASRAVARVDREGLRGITLLSVEEIEAMAIMLAILGFPIPDKPEGEET